MGAVDTARGEVRVGDVTYRIRPFMGAKGLRAMAIVSRVGERAMPVLKELAAFDREWRESHVTRITREMAEMRLAQTEAALPAAQAELDAAEQRHTAGDEDAPTVAELEDRRATCRAYAATIGSYQRQLDGPLRDRTHIDLPQEPSDEVRFMRAFPKVFEIAEEEVIQLIALVLISDTDLADARRDKQVPERLTALGEEVVDHLEIDELADLALTAAEMAVEKFRPRIARFTERAKGLRAKLRPKDPEKAEDGTPTEIPPPLVGSVVRTPSEPPRPSGSTDSPAPTDGTPTESSSESTGVTSSPSAG